MQVPQGFRTDSIEVHFGRTLKVGDFENIRADLKLSGVATNGSAGKIIKSLFEGVEKEVEDQLSKSIDHSFRTLSTSEPITSGNSNGGDDGNEEKAADNAKTATLKQYKCVWAIAGNRNFDRNYVYELMRNRLGVSSCKQEDIVEKVDRRLMSDFIKELQEIPTE